MLCGVALLFLLIGAGDFWRDGQERCDSLQPPGSTQRAPPPSSWEGGAGGSRTPGGQGGGGGGGGEEAPEGGMSARGGVAAGAAEEAREAGGGGREAKTTESQRVAEEPGGGWGAAQGEQEATGGAVVRQIDGQHLLRLHSHCDPSHEALHTAGHNTASPRESPACDCARSFKPWLDICLASFLSCLPALKRCFPLLFSLLLWRRSGPSYGFTKVLPEISMSDRSVGACLSPCP